ncbi:MAG: polysaccharide deacetylase family protein [Pirellulaceae bacterium]
MQFLRTVTLLAMLTFMTSFTFAEDSQKKYIIIHADDAGMSHSVNRATIQGMQEGIVSSASIMVPCPWFPEFARFAKEHPNLDYGIHLTLNSEWELYRWGPVAGRHQVPSLVDEDGFLWDNVAQVAQHAKAEDVETELRAQIERAKAFGVPLSHLDTHMGSAFCRPDIAKVYIQLGLEYKLPVLVVRPTETNQVARIYPEIAKMLKPLEDAGFPILDEVYQFYEHGDYEKRKQRYLEAITNAPIGVSEIIIHCGFDDHELRQITNSVDIRDTDRKVFTDPEVRAAIQRLGVQIITWKQFQEMNR